MNEEQQTPLTPEAPMTAGQSFVKAIRPLGCVLFLGLAILVAAVCLTSGRKPIPGYEPPMTTEQYAADLSALEAELEENVFPRLEYEMSAEVTGDAVTVTVETENFVAGRAAVLRYFDESLLLFERG